MKSHVWMLAAGLACLAGGTAWAQPNAARPDLGRLPLAAQADGTPLTIAFVYSPSFYGIELNKGVASVTSPSTGIYCVQPRAPLKASALPVVQVDWGGSQGNSLAAAYSYYLTKCSSGQIEVHTYDFTGAPTNLVAFIVTVV
jgi:hypothetical protein